MTLLDYAIGLVVFAAAAACGFFTVRRFDAWFPSLAQAGLAHIAGKAMLWMSTALVVGVALSSLRISYGMVPAVHGDLGEFQSLLIPSAGLLAAVVVALLLGNRVLSRPASH